MFSWAQVNQSLDFGTFVRFETSGQGHTQPYQSKLIGFGHTPLRLINTWPSNLPVVTDPFSVITKWKTLEPSETRLGKTLAI